MATRPRSATSGDLDVACGALITAWSTGRLYLSSGELNLTSADGWWLMAEGISGRVSSAEGRFRQRRLRLATPTGRGPDADPYSKQRATHRRHVGRPFRAARVGLGVGGPKRGHLRAALQNRLK